MMSFRFYFDTGLTLTVSNAQYDELDVADGNYLFYKSKAIVVKIYGNHLVAFEVY